MEPLPHQKREIRGQTQKTYLDQNREQLASLKELKVHLGAMAS